MLHDKAVGESLNNSLLYLYLHLVLSMVHMKFHFKNLFYKATIPDCIRNIVLVKYCAVWLVSIFLSVCLNYT